MKIWYRVFLVLSLLALTVGLYRADYMRVPEIVSGTALIGSLPLLFGGFLVAALCWKGMLGTSGFRASLASCIAGYGLSVFGKFIPGKVWTVVGRAAYIAQHTDSPLAQLSLVSLRTQLLETWSGLILGAIGLCAFGALQVWGTITIVLWSLLTILIFSSTAQRVATVVGRKTLSKDFQIEDFDFMKARGVLPWFALQWFFWASGFYLMTIALVGTEVGWAVGLAFPLATSFGILAVIAPGGLGVREGVLTGCLILAGIPVTDATTVAVASRLWFLVGEAFFFTVGLVASRLEVKHCAGGASGDQA